MKPQKKRESNLELYRIILMLAIIAHHYVVNSGLLETAYLGGFTFRSVYLVLLGAWGKIGINCFILITGYYMCKSKITFQKFLKLLLEIVFYNTVVYLSFVAFGYISFDMENFLYSAAPIKGIVNDFSSCYIVFYLFIPFINKILKGITKRQHIALLALALFTYSIIAWFLPVTFNYVTWFIVMYLIGAFIRLHATPKNETCKRWGILSAFTLLLAMFSVVGYFWHTTKIGYPDAYRYIMDANKPLAVIVSVSLFMFFKSMKPFYSRAINLIASSTFGVLLIHANSDLMRYWLWQDTLKNVSIYYTGNIYVHSIIAILLVYIACTIIDQLRLRFIEKPLFQITARYISATEKIIESKLLS